jgi:hypothetical protein
VIPFFAHPKEIRRVIYTTNAIESLNMSLRKVTKSRSSFPNDEAVLKLLYLALRNIEKRWNDAAPKLEVRPQSVRDPVRRPRPDPTRKKMVDKDGNQIICTKDLTLPGSFVLSRLVFRPMVSSIIVE